MAREMIKPIAAGNAKNFIFESKPDLSVRAPTHARIGYRIQEIHFALIGSKHEVSCVWIIGIVLDGGSCRSDSTIHDRKIALVFNLKSGSHILLVRLDCRVELGDGLQVSTFAWEKFYWSVSRWSSSGCRRESCVKRAEVCDMFFRHQHRRHLDVGVRLRRRRLSVALTTAT